MFAIMSDVLRNAFYASILAVCGLLCWEAIFGGKFYTTAFQWSMISSAVCFVGWKVCKGKIS